jgi:alkylation response protein AidB-like acyl-CoA dehydrogenase
MSDTILYDSAFRLFSDHVTAKVLAAAEAGEWPAEVWDAVEEAGYLDVLADGPAAMVEAATILRAAGHHAAPIPLAETMLARSLCAACGLEPPAGPLTIAPVEPDDRILLVGDTLTGRAGFVPWGRDAAATVLIAEGRAYIAPKGDAGFEFDRNLAGEPRDHLQAIAHECVSAPLPNSLDPEQVLRLGALMRAAQMAGAAEAALELSVRYANDRVQFGRPIGKFQAIQQQLALLAEEVAASIVVVEGAAIAVAEDRASAAIAVPAAKIRTGEAAGEICDIAHQVHGAIGFTEEHSLHHLTRRLWSWRDEFGDEAYWALALGRHMAGLGADALWPTITAL